MKKSEIIKIAWQKWEDDQKTNPNPVNPHAFTYGFECAVTFLQSIKEPEEYKYCPFCGEKLQHEVFTDINTKKICKSLLCYVNH